MGCHDHTTDENKCVTSLVTKKAPNFTAKAVMPNGEIKEISLHDHIKGKYCVLFFYPLDFTFVCPTEILAFDNRIGEFKSRNVEIIAVSVDSHFCHAAWRNTPVNKGGIGEVKFPMVADMCKSISKDYGVLLENAGIALRGSFLIDKDGVVRHALVNDLPLGRNVDETLRMIDALKFFEQHGEVCPAGWTKDKEGMKATSEGVAQYLASNADKL